MFNQSPMSNSFILSLNYRNLCYRTPPLLEWRKIEVSYKDSLRHFQMRSLAVLIPSSDIHGERNWSPMKRKECLCHLEPCLCRLQLCRCLWNRKSSGGHHMEITLSHSTPSTFPNQPIPDSQIQQQSRFNHSMKTMCVYFKDADDNMKRSISYEIKCAKVSIVDFDGNQIYQATVEHHRIRTRSILKFPINGITHNSL